MNAKVKGTLIGLAVFFLVINAVVAFVFMSRFPNGWELFIGLLSKEILFILVVLGILFATNISIE